MIKTPSFSKTILSKIKCISILILFLSMSIMINNSVSSEENKEWTTTLTITTSTDLSDTLVFGEKQNASNNKDQFDMPKPPAPQTPYIRAWFQTTLDMPYDRLWEEYKTTSSETNTWNFTITYEDTDEAETTTTINWDKSILKNTDYTSINLSYNNEVIANMITEDSYSYTQQVGNSYDFKITGQKTEEIADEKEENNETNPLLLFLPILIIIIIGIIVLYWKKNKN